jgi:hypothetical protein
MPAISAVDSVSFAIQRTRDFLFRPFRWGSFLKLGLVAIVTEGIGNNPRSSTHGGHAAENGAAVMPQFHLAAEQIAVVLAALLLALVVAMFVFYLVTRLRFAFFHCLIHNTKEIRPGWELYRDQASRFFWLNVVVGVCFVALLILVAIPFAALLWRVVEGTRQAGHLEIGLFIGLVLPLIPVAILMALIAILSDVILRDWMLPHFALENATAGEAWAQVRAHMKAEKRQFLVYALLRLILPTIALVGMFIVLLLPGLGLAATLALVEFSLHSMFANATGGSWLVGVLLQVFFGVIAFGFAVVASVCLGGPLSTGIREYALIFYGGRYQALGNILYPAPPAPPAIAPGTA